MRISKNLSTHAKSIMLAVFGFAIVSGESISLAVDTTSKLVVTIQTPTNVVMCEHSIILTIEVTNTGGQTLNLPEPSLWGKSIRIIVHQGEVVVAPQRKWSSGRPSKIDLAPGQSNTVNCDLLELYPLHLPGGVYSIRAEYVYSPEVVITSNEITVEVQPLPQGEQDAFNAYKAALKSVDDVELEEDFLTNYPNSVFADKVRMNTAFALRGLKQYDASIAMYSQVVGTTNSPQFRIQDAIWQLAQTYYAKGDLTNAINTVNQLHTPAAVEQAEDWNEELHPTNE